MPTISREGGKDEIEVELTRGLIVYVGIKRVRNRSKSDLREED